MSTLITAMASTNAYASISIMISDLSLPLGLWAIGSVLMLVLEIYIIEFGPSERVTKYLSLVPITILAGSVIASINILWLAIILFWDLLNAMRLFERRMEDIVLIKKVASAWAELVAIKLIAAIIYYLVNYLNLAQNQIIDAIGIFSVLINIVFIVTVIIRLGKSHIGKINKINNDKLPTVTLAIPARNENHALKEALDCALTSNYPKLEILVLDDCSQDDTSGTIREYAHSGIRFIKGERPVEGWLGKNYAYKLLAEEASGEIIVFCGVDVHFSPNSLRRIIEYMIDSNLSMISVMPERRKRDLLPNLFSSLRYFWQIVFPHELFGGKPVLSSCWAINKKFLSNCGDFKRVYSQVIPEEYFAKVAANNKKYKFLISDHTLGITTRKKFGSQLETSVRNWYPQMGKNLNHALSAAITILICFIIPFFYLAELFIIKPSAISLWMIFSFFLAILLHITVSIKINHANWLMSLINIPLVSIIEIGVLCWSMLMYEFGKIYWKGRNVCLPYK